MSVDFLSQYTDAGRFEYSLFPDETIKNEPMFFQMPLKQALQQGGPITRAFLSCVPLSEGNMFLDSRVHMLMPGWWPCIPGWHHDDVERSRPDGQPNYHTASYRPWFAMGLVGSAHCPTQFKTGAFSLPEVENGIIYKEWHPIVDADHNQSSFAQYGKVLLFDDRTLHQGTECVQGGWRWFGRVTYGNPITPAAQVRQNANVYMPVPMEGW